MILIWVDNYIYIYPWWCFAQSINRYAYIGYDDVLLLFLGGCMSVLISYVLFFSICVLTYDVSTWACASTSLLHTNMHI